MLTQNGFIWWHFRVENETMTFFLKGACAKHSLWLEEIATCVSGLFLASSWLLSVQKSLSILSWIRPTMSALCLLLTVFAASVYSGKIKIYCLSNLDCWSLRFLGVYCGMLRLIWVRVFSEWCWNIHVIWVWSFSPFDSKDTAASFQTWLKRFLW